jgi:hypothetical protein
LGQKEQREDRPLITDAGKFELNTLKHEALNGFCVVSEKHLDRILRRAAEWYNYRR